MKKILYIVEYLQNEPNSVSNILSAILTELSTVGGVQQVVASVQGNQEGTYDINSVDGFKTYRARRYHGTRSLLVRVRRRLIGARSPKICNINHIRAIVAAEKPDLVVFFLFSPEEDYTKICQDSGIPFIYMLYDTYIGRPGLDKERAEQIEKAVIDQSAAYYVPSFFYAEYKQYNSEKVYPYDLPLVIGKEKVKAAFNRNSDEYVYTYFGQVQNFRNAEKIKNICRQLNIRINVFPSLSVEEDDVFKVHPSVSGSDMYDVAAHSRFLIAFDNSVPYNHYLPSKAYLYVSFTKPVIAFGDNKDSALIDFFKGYPNFYYHNINENTDGLMEFIANCKDNGFNEELYEQFTSFLPEKALSGIKEKICFGVSKNIEDDKTCKS